MTWYAPHLSRYPSHARMWLAPIRTGLGEQKSSDFHHSMAEWHRFCEETRGRFGVSMNCLSREYEEEQHKFFLQVGRGRVPVLDSTSHNGWILRES